MRFAAIAILFLTTPCQSQSLAPGVTQETVAETVCIPGYTKTVRTCCLVCSGQITLQEAQSAIMVDWKEAYHTYAKVKCRRAGR